MPPPETTKVLNSILPEVIEQLHLRPIRALLEEAPELRVPRLGEPAACDPIELLLDHAGVRGGEELHQRLLAERMQGLVVVFDERLERLALLERWILRCELLHAVREKEDLHLHRLLAPECTVVIEGRDALGGRDIVPPALLRHACDEVDNRSISTRRRSTNPASSVSSGGGPAVRVTDAPTPPPGRRRRSRVSSNLIEC